MEKKMFAVVNKNTGAFLSHWEDGEGNDYYSLRDWNSLNKDCFFDSRVDAENHVKSAKSSNEFSKFKIDGLSDFCEHAKVIPVNVEYGMESKMKINDLFKCPNCKSPIYKVVVVSYCTQEADIDHEGKIIGYPSPNSIGDTVEIHCSLCDAEIRTHIKE